MDINCDMGENIGNDEEIMPYITSANIACGFHAGGPAVMQAAVRSAKRHGVAVGAHPGWPDREGFGRNEMSLDADEIQAIMLYQIGALAAIAKAEHVELHHVKPHGALYNQAAKDRVLADAIAGAIKSFSADLVLVGLAGSGLISAGIESGLRIVHEGFPDRNYNPNGTLMSRKLPGALIESPEDVSVHALTLARDGILFDDKYVRVDTLCLHGDHPHAAQNARSVRAVLEASGIIIAAF